MISISFRFSPVSRRAFLFSISPSFFQKKKNAQDAAIGTTPAPAV